MRVLRCRHESPEERRPDSGSRHPPHPWKQGGNAAQEGERARGYHQRAPADNAVSDEEEAANQEEQPSGIDGQVSRKYHVASDAEDHRALA